MFKIGYEIENKHKGLILDVPVNKFCNLQEQDSENFSSKTFNYTLFLSPVSSDLPLTKRYLQ